MQLKYYMVTIEDLVPENHFLRRLEAALDLSCVHEETAHLYSQRYGRPPIDPVVMVKYLLLVFLYGIPSERQIEVRCAAVRGSGSTLSPRPFPIQQSRRGRSGENGLVASGHGVQKIYKNTAPVFVGSGVLRKVDSPLNCCVFVCSC